MAPSFLKTPEEYRQLVDSVDTFLLDCDGVIYHGSHVVEGVKETLKYLRQSGKKIIFVTNNASKSRRQYLQTFEKLGIDAKAEEIFGSGYAAAVYLSTILKFPKDKKVYVIGEAGLEEELDSVGIAHAGGSDPEDLKPITRDELSEIRSDPSVGAVLCGFDIGLNYRKLAKAFTYLRENPDCRFMLTNQDPTYPTSVATGDPENPVKKVLLPGSGSLSYPLVYASKRDPEIIGKPYKPMMDAIIAEHHFDPKRAIMVGDNLLTDIQFGINSGVRTLCVLGGVTKDEQLFGDKPSDIVPNLIMNSFGDFAILAQKE